MDRRELQRVRLRQPCPVVGRDIGKKTSRFVGGCVEHCQGKGEEANPGLLSTNVRTPPPPTPLSGSTGVSSGLPWVWAPNLCRWSSPMVLKEGPQDRSSKMAQKHVRNTNCLPLSDNWQKLCSGVTGLDRQVLLVTLMPTQPSLGVLAVTKALLRVPLLRLTD